MPQYLRKVVVRTHNQRQLQLIVEVIFENLKVSLSK